ncbi:MAG: leucine dehydrogenase [Acidimicrobiia bacterium]|nr:leucine dehydrogenase [Acidimicrobiia bacterium]
MGVFDLVDTERHQSVHFGADNKSGLRSIIAIHDTTLGPALGGTRFYPYVSEEEALIDVLRLSQGMTYKAACAGLDLGGGKAVIIGDPAILGSHALFRAYGRFVDSLGGTYITAEDVGTTVADMAIVRQETDHVSGLPMDMGGSGDPSPATARGVISAMEAVSEHLWGTNDLAGRRVAIKGIGKVGFSVAKRLHRRGAELVVADINASATDKAATDLGAKVTSADDIHAVDCDIFAPCALGSDINATTVPQLACLAVTGSANNQLETPEDAVRLKDAGITYVPDFVANAGGIINIAAGDGGYSSEKAIAMIDRIRSTVAGILTKADELDIDTHTAAVLVADERIATAKQQKEAP